MTLKEIKASNKEFLTASDIAPVIQCNPQSLRNQAKRDASKLGFPVTIINNRILFPRVAFLHYIGEEAA